MVDGNLAMANFFEYNSEGEANEAYEHHVKKRDEMHKWKEVDVPEKLKPEFKKKFVCVRGECNCEKLLSKFDNYPQYERDGQLYSYAPVCHGDKLLNEQGIDE